MTRKTWLIMSLSWLSLFICASPAALAQESETGADKPGLTLSAVLVGAENGSGFGYRLAGLGDVDGDGFADLAVNDFGYMDGRVRVFLGGRDGIDPDSGLPLVAAEDSEYFGFGLAGVGDVNGDGFNETVVADVFSSWIYWGAPEGPSEGELLLGDSWSNVSGIGDSDADGYADFAFGQDFNRGEINGERAGAVLVLRGSPNGVQSETLFLTPLSARAGDYFGGSVDSAGDVNGDGFSDLIVGAPGRNQSGAAFVYLGSEDGVDRSSELILRPPDSVSGGPELFGSSVAGAGDVNSDGYDDVLVGAVGLGAAYLFLGSPEGIDLESVIRLSSADDDSDSAFASAVSSGGDLNADGYDDILIGSPSDGHGSAFVFFGGKDGPSDSARRRLLPDDLLDDQPDASRFGTALADVGDTNGDGFNDLVVSAPQASLAFVFGGPWTGGEFGISDSRCSGCGSAPNSSRFQLIAGFALLGILLLRRRDCGQGVR